MTLRSLAAGFVVCLGLVLVGCGSGENQTASEQDLKQFLQENPDAAQAVGQEPAGASGSGDMLK
ncbi:MAG: hypothetical protein CBB71_12875 [Rhodopirellula sp. TMED11]|nr:MAG: hypothetical protein CBB71_12875 [Rhodopirellula sp. TMED11]